MKVLFILLYIIIAIQTQIHLCFGNVTATQMLILPLMIQETGSESWPRELNNLSFNHNVTLTVSLSVGTPQQNVTMVLDTGSELSWLQCNTTTGMARPMFDPTLSSTYTPVNCSSPTCTTQTRDFPIPTSCDSNKHCHAMLSYADATSSEGNLASDTFNIGASGMPGTIFGCMDSGSSSNSGEDNKTTGLMGMNRGPLSFVSQMNFSKFSYCIPGSDHLGVLVFSDGNSTWLKSLNYTPLIQISTPLPYFDRSAYTVQLLGFKVSEKMLPLPESILEPDHTGAGQTMIDSGTQFTFLVGPAYTALKNEFLNQTNGTLQVLNDPDYAFQGAMDLCYLLPLNQTNLPVLPSISIMLDGAEMNISGDKLLYTVPGEVRDNSWVACLTFGNSDLLGIEAYIIGHHHQQNLWIEFDLENSRVGIAPVQCDIASQKIGS
ncbi:aspartic proteinase PCS1-like [Apium graveolens]|uniref:aspartic proteinase PCS1-like n=1 Tax=Apium graveolens TaxID=4045 RepID=UPI003D7AF1CB